jgi:hypothetical protein
MSEDWLTTTASDVRPGDRVRLPGDELTVTRVESPFMGMTGMTAFIEDTPERWIKRPVATDADVVVLR